MVVLESTGLMTSSSGHQYLQPDYLSPLSTTLDAKKSPLALLAQTCSQIGADSPSTKSLLPSLTDSKSKKSSNSSNCERSSPAAKATADKTSQSHAQSVQVNSSQVSTGQTTTSTNSSLAFKPYEANVLTKKNCETPRPPSKPAAVDDDKRRTPSRKSASPGKEERKQTTPPAEKDSGASPIIRSGLEVLQGTGFKPTGPLGLPPGCCPPGLEANPAFRPPLAGFSPHHLAYPGSPYLSYARVKTPAGGEALVPVCKDPYCAGCQLSLHGAMGPCPAGCTQCEQQKYLASLMSPLAAYQQLGRPYVCNWIAGDNYCGKRFTTSEELLQHLRSHTTGAESLLGPLRYPNPPLSPLSARYHPYSKPGLPLASPFSPFPPSALGPYYSPYASALYNQRLGAAAAAAAVHP